MKIILSGLNGHNVQEQQHLKHVPSSTPPAMGEHLEPNSQMELVGHSIVLTSYPYPDPHYGGIMAYRAQCSFVFLSIFTCNRTCGTAASPFATYYMAYIQNFKLQTISYSALYLGNVCTAGAGKKVVYCAYT
ncbi:hypothetical protein TEA_016628 [Camellia sinensis var. sinensis]|uniref:Uncharacterized protein n=1 Tax=Camellia sinensis var. sinensis TaxID=542762 RepID=A0A4S4DWB8_CAMSN|nr:hypothetical protein TEA_016628 [Camellia sinensis var. sinensis]